jgi:hypothetical protein
MKIFNNSIYFKLFDQSQNYVLQKRLSLPFNKFWESLAKI